MQQLLVHLYSLVNSLSDGFQSDVVYLDTRKDFHSVSHDMLLAKLWSTRLCGLTWKFFVAYLYGHLQCVHVGTSVSNLLPVRVSWALCCLCFTIMIYQPLHYIHLSFTDDIKCHTVLKSAQDCHFLQ